VSYSSAAAKEQILNKVCQTCLGNVCVTEMTCIATSVADGTQRCKLATVTCPAW